jgi:hypothetical protein
MFQVKGGIIGDRSIAIVIREGREPTVLLGTTGADEMMLEAPRGKANSLVSDGWSRTARTKAVSSG